MFRGAQALGYGTAAQRWRVHDLRRSAATHMAELRIPKATIRRVLGPSEADVAAGRPLAPRSPHPPPRALGARGRTPDRPLACDPDPAIQTGSKTPPPGCRRGLGITRCGGLNPITPPASSRGHVTGHVGYPRFETPSRNGVSSAVSPIASTAPIAFASCVARLLHVGAGSTSWQTVEPRSSTATS